MEDELAKRVAVALSQSKTVEREARNLKQALAGIRDLLDLKPKEAQGESNGNNSKA